MNALLKQWVEAVVAMTTAHDHSGFTGAEYSTDDLLKPLFKAPIAQLREFAAKLADLLEGDSRVPFLVWSSFRLVVKPLVDKRPEGKARQLRDELAAEVANLVGQEIPREDWIEAMASALRWRSPEQLQEVKTAVKVGGKSRVKVRGRQSCTFLIVEDDIGVELAQVIM